MEIVLERGDIERILPHRDRWLLLDRAEVNKEDGSAKGYLTINEDHCFGHFPGNPIMPGVLRIEFIAQTLGVVGMYGLPEGTGILLIGGERYKFRAPAKLGDLMIAEVKITKRMSRGLEGEGKAFVNGKLVAESYGITGLVG